LVGAANSTVEIKLTPLTVKDFGDEGAAVEAAKAVSAPLERVILGTTVVVPVKLNPPIIMGEAEDPLALFLQITILKIKLESDLIVTPALANVNFASAPRLEVDVKIEPVGEAFAVVPVVELLIVGAANPIKLNPPSIEYPAATLTPDAVFVPETVKLKEFNAKLYPETGAIENSIYGVIGVVLPTEL
jgi:hypothetical protein